MIRSMTGYGKQSLSIDGREYQIEIKSVNHRYLDINIKMPKTLSYLEDTIKKEISEKIKRGKIDVFITFENNSQEGKNIKINKELAKLYINQLKELAQEEKISSNIEVIEIAKFPDILTIKVDEEDEKIKQEIMQTTQEATNKIIEMKNIEGEKIAQDLLQRISNIENKIMEISEKSTGLIQEYVVKLEKRIQEILKTEKIDKSRLAQEVVIYADKCSIEEEITRLKSHIYQFKNLISNNENETIGKKLDFIIQEMNRETNTIGSKANNLEITNGVIDIKTELEDIREQIQNIE
ncbi:yicC domain protein [Clostridium sp. CAG:389]|jgi:TIGR00255 family protein|nr:yicC domain protein [Clostridium sp. CAG:389]